ncbi:chondroitin AC/alginate lyase [Aspergillus granulosus]|uniref:Chondroitin AC/alginate lyase n=1 Tax=Aspergillus granulosus TaxID=176169 RepID=A0ABR4HY56_9EURO
MLASLANAAVNFANLPAHPRLLFTDNRVQDVLSMNETDAYFREVLGYLAKTAQTAITTPVSLSSASSWSSTIRMNVGAAAGMYRLTKDTTYSDWIIETLLSLSRLSDWNPSNFLNTADITMTVSLGYDWVYEELTDTQRTTIETAIFNKAFIPAMNSSINSWSKHTNNWAQVTHGCLIIGILAVGDSDSTLASEMLDFSLPKLKVSLEQYAPDGGYIEGYSYGAYAGIFLGLMMGALDTALEDDLGISSLEGMNNLGAWLTHGLGQTGAFSWADGAWTLSNANTLWSVGYWATRFQQSEWLQGMLSVFTAAQVATFQAFLFYNSSLNSPNVLPTMPRYNQFSGVAGMTYRTSWTSTNGWFFGFMGGFNGRSHGHLDAGSFVVDYKGYRWAELLGSDSYSLTDYFAAPRRWTYYRCRTEGSNTLSISPETQTALHFANQIPSANNSLLWAGSFDSSSRFGVANLTQAYANVTTSVLRGVAVLNDSQLLIRDEVVAANAVDIATSWHTTAGVTIGSDNRTATLVQGSITMEATLLSPPGAYFQLVNTNPCDAYTGCSEATNAGVYNLAVRLRSKTTEANILVVLAESGTVIDEFHASLTEWYSLCSTDCWEGENVEDPYWLASSEIYY